MRMLPLLSRNLSLAALVLLAAALAAADRPANPPVQAVNKQATTFAAQPGSLRRGNEVAAVAVATFGKTVAIARGSAEAGSGQLLLWDRSPDKEALTLATDTPLLALAFSPDAKTLAAGGADGTVQVRDPGTGKVRHRMHGHSGAVNALLFTPDNKQLVSAGQDGTIVVWNAATGKRLRTLRGHLDSVGTLTLRPSATAAPSDMDDFLRSLTAPFQWKQSEKGPVTPLLLASGSRDQTVKLWDLKTGRLLRTMHGHDSEVTRASFQLGNRQLITGYRDGVVQLWDVDQGKPIQHSLSGLSSIDALACNLNCFERLAVGSREGGLRLLHLQPDQPQPNVLGTAPEGIAALAFSSDDRWLVSGGSDGTVKLWETAERLRLHATMPTRTAARESFPILASVGSPDGKTLAVAGEDKGVDVLDTSTGELRHRLRGHEDFVSGLAFSPDSKTLATASFDGTVRLWDVSTGSSLGTLTGHKSWVFAVAFSPDGKQLASGGYDRTVRLWDVSRGVEVSCLRGHRGGVRCLAYSPDGETLASGSSDRKVRLWDLAAGKTRTTLDGHEGMVRSLAFSPDGKTLASASEDNTVRLWDVSTGKEKASYRHNDRVLSVAFARAGDVLVSGSMDQSIAVLDPVRATLRTTLRGHNDGVTGLVLTPDRRRLISASMDRTLAVWTAETMDTRPRTMLRVPGGLNRFSALAPDGTGLATAGDDNPLTLHRLQMEHARKAPQIPHQPVFGLTYSADGKTLAVCCQDGAVRLCDAYTGELKQTLKSFQPQMWCAAFSPDGKTLASSSGSWDRKYNTGGVILWDLATGKEKLQLRGHNGIIFSVSFSPDGKTLATASWDQTVRLWDVATGKVKRTIREASGPVRYAVFCPVGSLLATAAWDGAVKLWDPKTGKNLASLPTPQPGVNWVSFTPDGKTMAAAYNPYSGDYNDPFNAVSEEKGGIQLWDVAKRKELLRIDKVEGKVLALAFSPDGKRLASAGGAGQRFGEVRLWETSSGKEVAHLTGPTYWVEGVAFSPDGQALASGGGDFKGPSVVHVWNLETELGRRKLKADKTAYVRAVYSPDGKLLACGCEDGKVHLWDVAAGKVKTTLSEYTAAVTSLAFAADGKVLASGSEDGTVRVWDVPTGVARQTCKPGGAVLDVALSPDGKTLAVCTARSVDGTAGRVRLWDVSTGKEREGEAGLGKDPLCVAFAPDGKLLAVGLAEGVEVWDMADGKRVSWLQGVRMPRSLAFAPDSRQLVAAQDAGGLRASATLVVWELSTASEKTLMAGGSRVVEMRFNMDGSALTGVASDGSVQQWKLSR